VGRRKKAKLVAASLNRPVVETARGAKRSKDIYKNKVPWLIAFCEEKNCPDPRDPA